MADEDIKKSILNYYGKPKDYEPIFMKIKINNTDKLIRQIKYDIGYLQKLLNNNILSLSNYITKNDDYTLFFYIYNFNYVKSKMTSATQKVYMKQFEQKEFVDKFEQFKKYYSTIPNMFIIGSKYDYLDNRHQFFINYVNEFRHTFQHINTNLTIKIDDKIKNMSYTYIEIIAFITKCLDAKSNFVKQYKIINSLYNNLINMIPLKIEIPPHTVDEDIHIILTDTVKNGLLVKLYNETNIIFKKTMSIIDTKNMVPVNYYKTVTTKYKNNKKIVNINNITKEQLQQIISKISNRVNNTPRNSLSYKPKVLINNKIRMSKSNTINNIAINSLYNNIKLRAEYIIQSNGIKNINISPFFRI